MYEINRCFYRYLRASLHGNAGIKMDSIHYPAPWNKDSSDHSEAETQRLQKLLEEESRKMQKIEEKSALEIRSLKKEIEELKEKIEKQKQEQNQEGNKEQGEK